MNFGEMMKKYWTSMLGVLFVLVAFITLFQYTVDRGWVTDSMKMAIGLLVGAGLAAAGYNLASKPKWAVVSQIVMGVAASVLYMTISFSGIYYELLDSLTVLLGMGLVTVVLALYAYRNHSRLLVNISMAGGIISPLMMRPETDQVFALFLYLLVMNAAFIYLSVVKRWLELRIAAFCGTWILYAVYFFHFEPSLDGVWSMAIRYALSAFLFYQIAFLVSSWYNKRSFEGLDMYLGIANGVLFGFWSLLIWQNDLHYAYPIALIGFVFLLSGTVVNRLLLKVDVAAAVYWTVGLFLILLSLNQAGSGMEIKPLVNVYIWGGVAVALVLLGQFNKWLIATIFSVSIWFFVGLYWYVVTWSTPRGEWFGVYIPFLNWGAIAWVLLAAIGFYYATRLRIDEFGQTANRVLANVYSALSHFIIGGLLSRQIENIFTEYFPDAPSVYMNVTLTVTWGIYALLLFLWGAFQREKWYKWFGSVVLVFVAIKAIFMDLSGQESLYKVMALLLLGAISFTITWINGRWSALPNKEQAQHQDQTRL
ncbi:DUF2339 domain-containing protein [Paenibacillus sp. NEAU-GSW1]|uniref:DUF2339 domain-containing protein n=1 Tax=Paenibacillus sp. NEAU-GSW1 TaxID=2682486 RepID=UPI00156468BB|nr:DUF2339 domain-containing protein [Paenibacillus sp. NEAU-GSW1]